MRTFGLVLFVAALVGLATGDRRFRLDRAPLRRPTLFYIAAALEVGAVLPPLGRVGFGSGLGRALTMAGFLLLLVALAINWHTPGIFLMAIGVGLNLLVITANLGRMPVEREAARAVGASRFYESAAAPGPHRHMRAEDGARLRWLDDRIPLPWRQVISAGDVILVTGAAWWLLAALGSRLLPVRSSRPDGALTPSARA